MKQINYLKAIYLKILTIISFFIPIDSNKILIIDEFATNSHLVGVYKKLKESNPKLKVEIIDNNPHKRNIIKQLKLYNRLITGKIIVTTHGPILKTRKNICVELWHGMSFKGTNLMNNLQKTIRSFSQIDYLISYSPFFRTIQNSCFGIKGNKYVILGNPVNDLLFSRKKKNQIYRLLKLKRNSKIIVYAPTHRDNIKKDKNYENFIFNLGFKDFNFQKFNKFLAKNNFKFILKPHPFDDALWIKLFKKLNLSNIFLLTEEYLIKNNLEFYNILGLSDLLITDYSSIFIDYLLINKPIIFVPTDINQYQKSRMLVLQPYDFWTPGPKCFKEENFKNEIIKCLKDRKYYEKERKILLNIFHQYKDNKSTDRIVKFITDLLKQNKSNTHHYLETIEN